MSKKRKLPLRKLTEQELNGFKRRIDAAVGNLSDSSQIIADLESHYIQGKRCQKLLAASYNNRGILYKNQGERANALADYSKAIELDPNAPEAYSNRGNLYQEMKRNKDALADYSKAIKLDPNYLKAYNNRGSLYADEGKNDNALADFDKAIELDSSFAEAYNSRGSLYGDQGKNDNALADFDKAIELDSNFAEAYDNRGTLYKNQGESANALADFDKAIELDSSFAKAYNHRGILYKNQGESANALADYDKAIELDPNYPAAYNNRGNLYQKMKRDKDALADYDKAIEFRPNYPEAYNNRGILYADQGKNDNALADYSKAIELDPNYPAAYNNRGVLYQEMKRNKDALADFDKAIELDSSFVKAYYNRGNLYKEVKRYKDALADYNAAIRKGSASFARVAKYRRFTCYYEMEAFQQSKEALAQVFQHNKPAWLLTTQDLLVKVPETKSAFETQLRKFIASSEATENLGSWLLAQYLRHCIVPANDAFGFFLGSLIDKQEIPHSQRIKRLESIMAKLERFSDMQLLRMQDIAGHRLIFQTMKDLYDWKKTLEEQDLGFFTYKRTKDYIQDPKEDGYRSVHLIFKLDINDYIFSPFQVELQLRTKIQHYWATTVEVVDTFHGSFLKQGQKDPIWNEFFRETSQYLAELKESGSEENRAALYRRHEEQFEELRQLQENAVIKGVTENSENAKKKSFFLIKIEDSQVEYWRYDEKEEETVRKEYRKLELEYQDKKQNKKAYCVFLTSTDSFEQLKELYPNYFAYTQNFLALFRPAN